MKVRVSRRQLTGCQVGHGGRKRDAGHGSGLACDPTTTSSATPDGAVNHSEKIERPGVFIENGHVTGFTFAVIDILKEQNKGNDRHGSKVIVVRFDGVAMDRDLAGIVKHEKAAAQPAGGK